MNVKANVDFIHNSQPVKQAEVISVSQEDGEDLVHSGLAFETSEEPVNPPRAWEGEPINEVTIIEEGTVKIPEGVLTPENVDYSPGQSKPRTSKKKNQS